MLPKSEKDLRQLVIYLVRRHGLPRGLADVKLTHARANDSMNMKNPRLFCSTEPGSYDISCSSALEDVAREIRVGVLIHELGHIMLGAFEGSDSEVDVDEWVNSVLPPCSYFYINSHEYLNSLVGEKVEARAVECVTGAFLKIMDAA